MFSCHHTNVDKNAHYTACVKLKESGDRHQWYLVNCSEEEHYYRVITDDECNNYMMNSTHLFYITKMLASDIGLKNRIAQRLIDPSKCEALRMTMLGVTQHPD